MATFQFDFVGPERTLYSGEVEAVQLPGTEGEMTVLPGHAPVLTSLKVGVITVTEKAGSGKRILVVHARERCLDHDRAFTEIIERRRHDPA